MRRRSRSAGAAPCRLDRSALSGRGFGPAGALSRVELARSRWESAQAPLVLGAVALALMAADDVDRASHQGACPAARAPGGTDRRRRLSASWSRAGTMTRVHDLERSINLMCAQLRQMSQTISQTERTDLLAQLAAGLAHQMRNALTGARLSLQLHLKRCDTARNDPSVSVALRQLRSPKSRSGACSRWDGSRSGPTFRCDLVRLIHDVPTLLEPTARAWPGCARGVVPRVIGAATVSMDEAGSARRGAESGPQRARSRRARRHREDRPESAGPPSVIIEVSDTGPVPRRRYTNAVRPVRDRQARGSRAGPCPGQACGPRRIMEACPGGVTAAWTRFRLSLRRGSVPGARHSARSVETMSRVLIVDDEASICWAFREFLGDQGHDVEIAASAEEGLRIAGTASLDAVVLDVRLPGMDGLSALARFRDLVGPGADHRDHGLRQPGHRRPGHGGRRLRLPGQALRPRPGRRSGQPRPG